MRIFFAVLGVSVFFLACGPTPPTEAEIRDRYVGTYCDGWKYRLELTDSTYMNRSMEKGTFQNDIYLRCNGNYEFALEEGSWVIRFQKDEWPSTTNETCEKTIVLWTKETGYNGGEGQVSLEAPLDGRALVKGPCDDI
ncbi:MAG: hypothetical protein AAF399_02435 [Bacteroidota bacterium]